MKNCVDFNIQILSRMYLMMLKKKIRKKTFNRKEMVGEMQPFLSVYLNRNKEQMNTNVGSESSISLLRKDVLSIQNPQFTRTSIRVNPQKVHPNPPIIKRVMALEREVIFLDFRQK